jgi:hypothetical protein
LEEVHQIVNKFHIHLDSQIFKRIPLETSHFHFASDYIRQFKVPLKTLDALHLAIVAKEKLILATADAELERAARFFGIKVQIIS